MKSRYFSFTSRKSFPQRRSTSSFYNQNLRLLSLLLLNLIEKSFNITTHQLAAEFKDATPLPVGTFFKAFEHCLELGYENINSQTQ